MINLKKCTLIFFLVAGFFSLVHCSHQNKTKTMTTHKNLNHMNALNFTVLGELRSPTTHLTSASGLVKHQNVFYAIGDDQTFFLSFEYNEALKKVNILQKIFAFKDVLPKDYTARKFKKPDTESLLYLQSKAMPKENGLLSIGSGSMKTRERAVWIPIIDGAVRSDLQNTFSMKPLYKKLFKDFQKSVNIEGLVQAEDDIVLFHRGNDINSDNFVAKLSIHEFSYLLNGPKDNKGNKLVFNTLTTQRAKIEQHGPFRLSFTDATYFNGRYFFLAAGEETHNPVDDGEISGTVLGEFFIKDGSTQLFGFIPKIKAEGLHVEKCGSTLCIYVVTDNDSPETASQLLLIKL